MNTRISSAALILVCAIVIVSTILPFSLQALTKNEATKLGLPAHIADTINWAAPNVSDLICLPYVKQACSCGSEPGPDGRCVASQNRYMCPCSDPRGVTGVCMATGKCQGKSFTGLGGGTTGLGGGLDGIVGQLFSGILQKLMQPSPPGSPSTPSFPEPESQVSCNIFSSIANSSASSTTMFLSWNSTGNVQSARISPNVGSVPANGSKSVVASSTTVFYLTVTGDKGRTNTCSSSGLGSTSSLNFGGTNNVPTLLESLSGGSSNISDLLTAFSGTNTGTSSAGSLLTQFGLNTSATTTQTVTASSTGTPLIPTGQAVSLPGGATGDIRVTNDGATVVVGTRDPGKNTETAGFFGTNTFGSQNPTGLVGQLCQTRPWANNFLSYIVPATFFDGLCSWRGYQVGQFATQVQPQVTVTQTAPKPVQNTTPAPAATSTAPVVEPKVDVWAVPAIVPLGARSSIFWNTQGVTSCTVSSPDGSFNQTTLSGGASTVSLTGATTFTISCLTPSGAPVTDYVTVNLAI